jgi:hypothetical protein
VAPRAYDHAGGHETTTRKLLARGFLLEMELWWLSPAVRPAGRGPCWSSRRVWRLWNASDWTGTAGVVLIYKPMHAKFMHELYSLLMHISTYLDVIIIFVLIYGDFPSILLILVITLQNRKILF